MANDILTRYVATDLTGPATLSAIRSLKGYKTASANAELATKAQTIASQNLAAANKKAGFLQTEYNRSVLKFGKDSSVAIANGKALAIGQGELAVAQRAATATSKAASAANAGMATSLGLVGAGAGAATLAVAAFHLETIKVFAANDDLFREATTKFEGNFGVIREEMRETARVFADEYNVSLAAVITAYDVAGGAGLDFADSQTFVDNALKFSRANFIDTAQGAEILIKAQKAWGLEASDIEGIMRSATIAYDDGIFSLESMGTAIGRTGASAKETGVDFNQMSASMAVMTQAGKSVEVGATEMNRFLIAMGNNTKGAGEAFEQIAGQSFTEFINGGGTVVEAVRMIDEHLKKTGQTSFEFFGSGDDRARRFFSTILNGGDTFEQVMTQMVTDIDTVDKRFAEATGGIGESWRNVTAQMGIEMDEIGEKSGALSNELDYLAEALQYLNIALAVVSETASFFSTPGESLGRAFDWFMGLFRDAPEVIRAVDIAAHENILTVDDWETAYGKLGGTSETTTAQLNADAEESAETTRSTSQIVQDAIDAAILAKQVELRNRYQITQEEKELAWEIAREERKAFEGRMGNSRSVTNAFIADSNKRIEAAGKEANATVASVNEVIKAEKARAAAIAFDFGSLEGISGTTFIASNIQFSKFQTGLLGAADVLPEVKGSGGSDTEKESETSRSARRNFSFHLGQMKRKVYGSESWQRQLDMARQFMNQIDFKDGRERVEFQQRLDDAVRSMRSSYESEKKREAAKKTADDKRTQDAVLRSQIKERRDAFSLQLDKLGETTNAADAERFRSSLIRRQQAIFDLTPEKENVFEVELAMRRINDQVDSQIESLQKETKKATETATGTRTTTPRTTSTPTPSRTVTPSSFGLTRPTTSGGGVSGGSSGGSGTINHFNVTINSEAVLDTSDDLIRYFELAMIEIASRGGLSEYAQFT